MALKPCIKATKGLADEDVTAVLDAHQAYKDAGVAEAEAVDSAIADVMASVEAERAEYMDLINTQHPEAERRAEGAERKERRKASKARELYAQMSKEELLDIVLQHELTNIPGLRALVVDLVDAKAVMSVDADSLKWVNDVMSPEHGDALLQAFADTLTKYSDRAYHKSGDEFYVLADSLAELEDIKTKAAADLAKAKIIATKPDGSTIEMNGLNITAGIAETKDEADALLKKQKIEAEARGERATRGEQPPGATVNAAEGQPRGSSAAEIAVTISGRKPEDVKAELDALNSKDELTDKELERVEALEWALGIKNEETTVKIENTDDVGVELAYNRRQGGLTKTDIEAADNDTARIELAKKKQLWKRPDYQEMVDGNVQPVIAHAVKQVYDSISTQPQGRGMDNLYAYVDGVEATKAAIDELLQDKAAQDDIITAVAAQASASMARRGQPVSILDMMKTEEANRDVLNYVLDRVFPKNESGQRWGRQNPEGNQRARAMGKAYKAMQFNIDTFIKALKEIEEGWPAKREAWQRSYKIQNRGQAIEVDQTREGTWRVIRGRSLILERFDNEQAAKDYAEALPAWYVFRKKGGFVESFDSKEAALEGVRKLTKREKVEKFKEPSVPIEKSIRNGPDVRQGKNVSTKELNDLVGFKGINFGNWMKGGSAKLKQERQAHTNSIYDAVHDLADILGLPVQAISLEGMLGVAVGAQGRGGTAAAHFVPGLNEINITRGAGAGSLAHEWGHALDHYFAVKAGKGTTPEPMLTEFHYGLKPTEEIRQEIIDAFNTIVKTMEKTEVEITPEQIEENRKAEIEKNQKRLAGELKYVRDSVEQSGNKPSKEFNALMTKLEAGEVGDYVKLGKSRDYVGANVNALREEFKKVTGRYFSLETAKSVNFWGKYYEKALNAEAYFEAHPKSTKKNTKYYSDAMKLETGKAKSYWSTSHEMFARAFESYVADKLAEKKQRNDYLTSRWKTDMEGPFAEEAEKRFPQGLDREAINHQFDNLIDLLRVRTTEQGVGIEEPISAYDESKADIETTFDMPAPQGVESKAVEPSPGQLDLFTETQAKSETASQRFRMKAKRQVSQVRTGSFNIGLDRVSSHNDAAHILAPLRKYPVEQFMVLALDKDMKPLSILRHTIGTGDGASVYPGDVAGAIFATPDVRYVYLAHNHPSGVTDPSNADRMITGRIEELLKGTGVDSLGHIISGPGADPTFMPPGQQEFMSDSETISPTAAARRQEIPVTEGKYTRLETPEHVITQPSLMNEFVQENMLDEQGNIEEGIVWMDNRNRIVGFSPMSAKAMTQLRTGNVETGAGYLLSERRRHGAMAAIATLREPNAPALKNLNAFADSAQLRLLDALYHREFEDSRVMESAAEQGTMTSTAGLFKSADSRTKTKPAMHVSVDNLNSLARQLKQELIGLENLTFHIRETQDEAFGEGSIERDGRIKGAFQSGSNDVVLIAENIESIQDALKVVRHEVVAHYGMRQLLNGVGEYDAILGRVWDARNGALKEAFAHVASAYPELTDKRKIADEMIARTAEVEPNNSFLTRILDEIVRLMRKYGLLKGPISRVELNSLLRLSARNLRGKIQQPAEVPMPGDLAYQKISPEDGAFKMWFGDSKVVDKNNAPLVVYKAMYPYDYSDESKLITEINRQTPFPAFNEGEQGIDIAGFFGGLGVANRFAREAGMGQAVYPVYLSLQNPYVVDAKGEKAGNIQFGKSGKPFRDAMRSGAYDGAIIENTSDEGTIYVAANPTQIKSALGNNTFDPDNPNILFARASEPNHNRFGMPEETMIERWVRLFQNGFNRVKKLQATIEERGGWVSQEADVYGAEELSSGKITARLDALDKYHMKPLIAYMQEKDIELEELNEFMQARHAKERNAYIASIRDDMPDGGSGWTNKEADDYLDAVEYKREDLEGAAEFVYAVNRQHLKDLVDGGLMAQETADMLQARYKYYVPLKGKTDEIYGESVSETINALGRGYKVLGAGIKRAFGRGQGNIAEDVVAHSFAQAETAIVRTEKNKVGLALVNLIRDNPDPAFWTISERNLAKFIGEDGELFEGWEDVPEGLVENSDYVPTMGITAAERKAAEAEGRQPRMKVVYRIDPGYKYRDDVFGVMIEGKELLINIKDKLVAEQLQRINASQLNTLTMTIGQVNRYLAMINTALNPEFVITNFERDLQTAMVNLAGEQSTEIAADVLKAIPSAIKGIWQETFDTKGTSPWRKEYEEMKAEGGTIGFFGLEDVPARQKRINARLERGMGVLGKTKKGILNVRDAVLDANISVENSARLASYKVIKDRLIAEGVPASEAKARAASVAKNLTVNFNRKGEMAPVMNSLYLFYNASIQGSARIFTALKSPRVRKIVGGVAVTAYALALYNRAMGGEDEDEIPYWDKIPEYTKQTNLIIMKPDGSGEYWKFRLPYGYNVFFYTGTKMHDLQFNERTTYSQAGMQLMSAVMNAFNPIQGADLLDTITPTVLKPWAQDVRNINFMERPIRPDYPFDPYDRPDSQKYFRSTNKQLVGAMEAMNAATGGDETHPGWFDVSPESVKHYVGWLTGGAGMFGTRTLGTALNLVTGEELEPKNIPFVRTVTGRVGKGFDTERFYESVKQIEAAKAQLKLYKGTDRFGDYRAEHSEVLKLGYRVPRVKRKIAKLRDQQDKAYLDKDYDLAAEIGEEMRLEMIHFSKLYEEAAAAQ